ncbi:MAG: hypothetical protein ACYDHN_03430 [Solirubrobacteraceae bacterium]
MSDVSNSPPTSSDTEPRPSRLPSMHVTAVLSAVMLAVGVAVGAAIGPAPEASFAGANAASSVAQRLPLLLSAIVGRSSATTPAPTTPAVSPPAIAPQTTPTPATTTAAPASSTPAPTQTSAEETASTPKTSGETHKSKLPAVTNVWLIELAGTTFAEAIAQPTAAPYITGQLLPAATLLSSWSALSASVFAGEAALAEPPAPGSTPPLLHSIVQPPCPEGAAGTACATGTPGELTAADEFLKATLATITTTPAYREHGLIVVTFATVAVPTQAGLPAGASSATLTYQPPAGVALMSPFVHAGARSSTTFNPTSPRQSLEKLLH